MGGGKDVWYKKFDDTTKREYFEINDYKITLPGECDNNHTAQEIKERTLNNAIQISCSQPEGSSDPKMRERQRIMNVMKTKKKSKCDGTCCIELEDQRNLYKKTNMLMSEMFQKHQCECIRVKSECGPECGCDPEKCKNRQMSLK